MRDLKECEYIFCAKFVLVNPIYLPENYYLHGLSTSMHLDFEKIL